MSAGRGLRAWCVDFKSTAATANHGRKTGRKIRSMKCGNRVTGNLTLSLVDEGLANDRVVGDIWVPCDPAWIHQTFRFQASLPHVHAALWPLPESPGYILCFDAFCSLLTLDMKDVTQQRWQDKLVHRSWTPPPASGSLNVALCTLQNVTCIKSEAG